MFIRIGYYYFLSWSSKIPFCLWNYRSLLFGLSQIDYYLAYHKFSTPSEKVYLCFDQSLTTNKCLIGAKANLKYFTLLLRDMSKQMLTIFVWLAIIGYTYLNRFIKYFITPCLFNRKMLLILFTEMFNQNS